MIYGVKQPGGAICSVSDCQPEPVVCCMVMFKTDSLGELIKCYGLPLVDELKRRLFTKP